MIRCALLVNSLNREKLHLGLRIWMGFYLDPDLDPTTKQIRHSRRNKPDQDPNTNKKPISDPKTNKNPGSESESRKNNPNPDPTYKNKTLITSNSIRL